MTGGKPQFYAELEYSYDTEYNAAISNQQECYSDKQADSIDNCVPQFDCYKF